MKSILRGVVALCFVALPGAAQAQTVEQAVLAWINHARANPQAYAAELRQYRTYFDGQVLRMPGDPIGVVTREGPAAVDEAIEFLERQEPLAPLSLGDVLALAARDHVEAQGALGAIGHLSRDGADVGERVRRRGGDVYVGETISYGYDRADEIVRQLIVDDGVVDRGHRTLLFDPTYRFAGVSCGAHAARKHICVVDLAVTPAGESNLMTLRRAKFLFRAAGAGLAETRAQR